MSTQGTIGQTASNAPAQYKKLREQMGALSRRLPGPMAAFSELHREASAPGALSAKHKELIALAIGITVRCNGCIGFHVHDALEAGASSEEIMETIGVSILMGGGPSMVYGAEALDVLRQFQEAEAPAEAVRG